jgi:endogenous inhibitor of DNA gyrase (YacG/DUF329 family)
MYRYSKESTRIEKEYRVYNNLTNNGKCIFCGDEFKSRSILAKYCSQRCKNDRQIKSKAEIVLKKRIASTNCIICKEPIEQNPIKKIRKYCSNKCKQKNYRLKQ